MQWKIILGPAWARRHGMSDADLASLFDLDVAGAVPADSKGVCPKCSGHPEDREAEILLDPESPTMAERVEGHAVVRCTCGVTYHYAAVHAVDTREPMGAARVRAASRFIHLAASAQITLTATANLVVTPETGEVRFGG